MIFEWEDPRKPGEALWPSRFPADMLLRNKANDPLSFEALYQGRPTAREGELFRSEDICYWYDPEKPTPPPIKVEVSGKWVERPQRARPPIDKFYSWGQSWDCTFKDKATSDFVSGGIWAMHEGNHFLLDHVLERLDIVATMDKIRKLTVRWPRTYSSQKLIEDKANGPAVMQLLRDQIPGMCPVNPEGGKVSRANSVLFFFKGRNVFFPHPTQCPTIRDAEKQLLAFDRGKHDDFVDMVTQWLNHNRQSGLEMLRRMTR